MHRFALTSAIDLDDPGNLSCRQHIDSTAAGAARPARPSVRVAFGGADHRESRPRLQLARTPPSAHGHGKPVISPSLVSCTVTDNHGVTTTDWRHFGLETLPGDLNGDGFVGAADLDIVRGSWGQTASPGDLSRSDPSGDGLVGSADLDINCANWGGGVPSASTPVPEPGLLGVVFALFATGALMRGEKG